MINYIILWKNKFCYVHSVWTSCYNDIFFFQWKRENISGYSILIAYTYHTFQVFVFNLSHRYLIRITSSNWKPKDETYSNSLYSLKKSSVQNSDQNYQWWHLCWSGAFLFCPWSWVKMITQLKVCKWRLLKNPKIYSTQRIKMVNDQL